MKPVLTRRRFLQAAAATAAVLPLPIQALANASVRSDSPKKIIFVYMPDGVVPEEWHATGTGSAFSFGNMSSPFEAIRNDVVMLNGIHMYTGSGHTPGMQGALTGGLNYQSTSLDLVIADQIGAQSPFRMLHLGVGANFQNGNSNYSTHRNGLPQSPNDSPVKAYESIFGKQTANNVKQLRLNAVDSHRSEVNTLRAMLGLEDRAVLDAHMEALNQLETQLNAAANGEGGLNPESWLAGWQSSGKEWPPIEQYAPNFSDVTKQQMQVMVSALRTGRTKVGHLQISHPVCPIPLSLSINELPNHGSAYHSYSHHGKSPSGTNYQRYVEGRKWFSEQIVYLVNLLKGTETGQENILADTLIVGYSELGDGMDHDAKDMPFFLAGGSNMLTGGRSLAFQGETHTKLLTSIGQMMGLNISQFGFTGKGTGALPSLV